MSARVRELIERRTREAKHFLNDDGTATAEISLGSRHYQAAPGGPWLDKKQQLRAGPGTAEWISDESDVTMHAYQTGVGRNRRWWTEFKEKLTGKGIAFELGAQPNATAGSKALSFAGGWTYAHTRAGGKLLGTPVAASEGAKSYTFAYSLIGGADPLTLQGDGSVRCGEVFTMAAPFLEGADGKSYAASSWVIDPVAQTLSFSYTDTDLPAEAYPYRVDPSTTFNTAVGGDDAYVGYYDQTTYGTGGILEANSTLATLGVGCARAKNSTGKFDIYNGLVRWNTASLPDNATVTESRFRGHLSNLQNPDSRSLTVDAYTGWPGGLPTSAHYIATAQTGALAGKPLSTLTLNALNDVVMDNVAGVSLTGYTSYRFHISGGQPSGYNELYFASFEHTTLAEPKLLVTYEMPFVVTPQGHTTLSFDSANPSVSRPTRSDGTALQVGDFLLAFVDVGGGSSGISSTTCTPPAGWASMPMLSTIDSGTFWFYKYVGASEPTSYAFALNSIKTGVLQVVAFSNINTPTPFATEVGTIVSSAASSTISLPSRRTRPGNLEVDHSFFMGGSLGGTSSVSPPTGFAEKYDVNTGALSTAKRLVEMAYLEVSLSGNDNTRVVQASASSGSQIGIAMELALAGSMAQEILVSTGIPSGEEFGTAEVFNKSKLILVSSLESEEAFGAAHVATLSDLIRSIYVSSLDSGEAFGTTVFAIQDDPTDPTRYGLSQTSLEMVPQRALDAKRFKTDYGTVVGVLGQQLHYQAGTLFFDVDTDNDVIDASTYRMSKHSFSIELRLGPDRGLYLTEGASGRGMRIHFPVDPHTVSRKRATFYWRGTDWTYANRKRGVKLDATYATRQGNQQYVFLYDLLGDGEHPVAQADGSLKTNELRIPQAEVVGADGQVYPCSGWSVDTSSKVIAFTFDDSLLPDAALPYVIDPTTDFTNVTQPRYDDFAYRDGSTSWVPTNTTKLGLLDSRSLWVEARKDGTLYRRSQSFFRFDTRLVPSTVFIKRAWLRVYLRNVNHVVGDGFQLGGEIHDWADTGLTATSYVSTSGATLIPAQPVQAMAGNSFVDLPINDPLTTLNRSGFTEIRLSPIVGRTPTGVNAVEIVSHEDPDLPGPMLLVEWAEGVAIRKSFIGNTGVGAGFIDVAVDPVAQIGDLMFVMLFGGAGGTTRPVITAPAGFSVVPNCDMDYSTVARARLYVKPLVQADLGTIKRFSWDGSRVFSVTGGYYQGADDIQTSAALLETVSAQTLNGAIATPTGQSLRVVMWHGCRVNELLTPIAGSGLTEHAEAGSTTAQFYRQAMSDFPLANGGGVPISNRMYDIAGTVASVDRMSFAVVLRPPLFVYHGGMPSDLAFGPATMIPGRSYINDGGLPSDLAFGEIKVEVHVKQLQGNPSDLAFGVTGILPGVTQQTGIPSGETFGVTSVIPGTAYINDGGLPSDLAFGEATTKLAVKQTDGIPSAEEMGQILVLIFPPAAELIIRKQRKVAGMLAGLEGARKFEPRLWVSNILGEQVQELPGAIESGSADFSNYRDNTWALSLDMAATDSLDPIHDYVLLTYDAWTEHDPPDQFPLGLYRFEFPTGEDLPSGPRWSLNGLSLEFLMFRKAAINGYQVPKGGTVFQTIRNILGLHGIPKSRLTIPPDLQDKVLRQGMVYDPIKDGDNSMFIRICNDILRRGGFGAIQTSAEGQFFFNDIVPLEEKDPSVFYGPTELGGDDMLHYVGIPYSPSYDRFANQVIVYNSNTTANTTADTTLASDLPDPPIKWTETNDNPDSPVSVLPTPIGLGYTVTKFIQLEDVTDLSAAKKIARAELSKASGYHVERTIATLLDPRRGPDEAYRVEAYNAEGLRVMSGQWNQVNAAFPLSRTPGDWIMSHTLTRSEKL